MPCCFGIICERIRGARPRTTETKRRLAYYLASNRTAYVTIKDPVCDLIAIAAEAWAAATGLATWDE